jgi:hypothetical protein
MTKGKKCTCCGKTDGEFRTCGCYWWCTRCYREFHRQDSERGKPAIDEDKEE